MHFKGLDLNLLVVLDALLTEKNTTRAGQRIYLSQPATSGALSRLREFFGDPLLIQSGQKMVLTPLAEGLIQPVKALLAEAEAIINVNSAFHPETSTRTFRLSLSDYVATVLMTRAVERMKQVAPGVRIEITLLQDGIPEALERGDLDFLIVPSEFMSTMHPAKDLFQDSYKVVAWSGNEAIGDSISLEQYLLSSHVITRVGRDRHQAFDEIYLNRAGHERRVEVVVPTFSLLSSFVIGTNLIATMHARLARYYSHYLPLKVLPMPIEMPPFIAKVQWHRYHDHDPGTKWFMGILKEAAREKPRAAQAEMVSL